MKAEVVGCPHCGAPLSFPPGGGIVLCVYCNSSIRVAPEAASVPADAGGTVRIEAPPEAAERVKQLILDGKRDEAIGYYAQQARISPDEARDAVEGIAVTLTMNLTRQAPLAPVAIAIIALVLAAMLAGIAFTVRLALAGERGWLILTAALALLAFAVIRALPPKLMSTWVLHHGAQAQARLLRLVVIRRGFRPGGALVTALLQVRPDDEAPFEDEETWLVSEDKLSRLEPGALLRVRYQRSTHDRVFPCSPLRVWDEARREYV
jgi:hypothetical protein